MPKHLLCLGALTALLMGCASPVQPVANTPANTPGTGTSTSNCDCRNQATPPAVTTAAPTVRYREADWSSLPNWPGDGLLASWPAWLQSCKRQAAKAGWRELCSQANALAPRDDAAVQAFVESRFRPWRLESSEGAQTGLVTGYYEPLLKGSRNSKPGYTPLFAPPDDLLTIDLGELYPELKGQRVRGRLDGKKVVPYWSRADIDAGKAPTSGLALAWVDDPIEAFFLEIQGSGRVKLEDGSLLRLGYADQNGQPYKSIGKWLIDQGELKASEASMQGIQAWARAHPNRLRELLAANPSVVFFRILPSTSGGPIGALGVPLTDGASVAVDPRAIPLGSPVYLSTSYPNSDKPLQRMVHAQDTGGAIRGPIRLDFFWGFGAEAGALAGRMKQQGAVWMLWPKDLPLPGENANR
ncbi:murein transglycosylase A [Chitinimonas sp.]|uniref:murein transglycosylase A n=1 Tax=Chitinimonas sp. TaxID=1934313 RepID=UPI0035B251C0